MDVAHGDREVEFHDLLDEARLLVGDGEYGNKSCEHIATDIMAGLKQKYNAKQISVSVFEDNECGAIITTKQCSH